MVKRLEPRSFHLLAHYRGLSGKMFTVVDVETTGSLAYRHRVTELSVLQATLEDGIQSQQTHLLNPQCLIPPWIVEVTGITQSMVDAAPVAADVLPRYLALLNVGVLTAHNLDFDYAFLRSEYGRLGIRLIRPPDHQLCTVELSRLMLADLPSRSLPHLVRHFGFSVETSHRAGADTLACWLLAQRLLTEIAQEPDEAILTRFGRQWIPLKIAARLLGCSSPKAQSRLLGAAIESRPSSRHATPMYRRGDVERIADESSG